VAPQPSNVDRAYRHLKHRLLIGEYSLGSRIDAQGIADDLVTSITPVRDAIQRLVGERLLDALPNGGFQATAITAPALLDLYDWNIRLAQMGAQCPPHPDEPLAALLDVAALQNDPEAFVTATAALFSHLAKHSGNQAHRQTVAQLNERLHAARLAEALTLKGAFDEYSRLVRTLDSHRRKAIADRLTAYNQRRKQKIVEIVGAIHGFHKVQR
jgi:DNA-binding GntR family transcriptional regulator